MLLPCSISLHGNTLESRDDGDADGAESTGPRRHGTDIIPVTTPRLSAATIALRDKRHNNNSNTALFISGPHKPRPGCRESTIQAVLLLVIYWVNNPCLLHHWHI